MSNKLRIILENEGDTSSIAVSPAAVATLPETNLQDSTRARVWRSPSTADQTLTGDFPGIRYCSGLALMRHNLTSAAQWRFELFVGAGQTGTKIYDSGLISALRAKTLGELDWGVDPLGATIFTGWALAFSDLWFTPVAARSWRLTISDNSNADGYIEASRLFMGRYLSPSVNASMGIDMRWDEDTKQEATDGGTLRSDASAPYRRLSFSLSWLNGVDHPQFMEAMRKTGKRKDFFISCYPEQGGQLERDFAMVAKLTIMPRMPHNRHNNYQMNFSMRES